MADTAIASFTDGVTANATDRIATARSPFGLGDDRYVTPQYIKDYILGQANAWGDNQTFTSGKTIGWNGDLFLARDAANTLALRNGANAQTFNVYNAYTDASNYELARIIWAGGKAYLQTLSAGIGSPRDLVIQAGSGTLLIGNNNMLFQTDNTYDIGASGAKRPRTGYFAGGVLASGTAGIGYVTGAGGTVTQLTSRTTGVTLNKICGAITLVSAAGSATAATFTVTNSTVAEADLPRVVQKSGADKYQIFVTAVAAGAFDITFFTTGGTTTEQPVFTFTIEKAVTA